MNPIYVAIDTPDLEQAEQVARAVKNHAGGLKLGLEFFSSQGPAGVRKLAQLGLPIFLDLKLHDIPNTVGKAIAAMAPLGPAILTVHAAGGRAMLAAAKESAPARTKVVAVTLLTSLDQGDLSQIGISAPAGEQVDLLARLARESGVDGIVCSGAEVAAVKAAWPDAFVVVPGVRTDGNAVGDQKRVVTPSQAIADGASVIVIGRPITQAHDPSAAIREIVATLPVKQEARIQA
jgi:orotidine-5'-phosphate decarboxylase